MAMKMNDRDHWLLISKYGDGKSTFGSQMSPKYLVADFDVRWAEQQNVAGQSYPVGGSLVEVIEQMNNLRPTLKDEIGTIIIDSGTSVIDTTLAAARLRAEEEAAAKNARVNMNEIHRLKADMMRALRGAILAWGCNSLWIFHYEDGMMNGRNKVRSTIPSTEIERLKSSLNAILSIQTANNGMRGIVIQWSRYHKGAAQGQVIWDTEGMWKGVPQKLSYFLRNYTGTEGYNGNTYSPQWLMEWLNEKRSAELKDVSQLKEMLNIDWWPNWFDKNAWGQLIKDYDALKETAKE